MDVWAGPDVLPVMVKNADGVLSEPLMFTFTDGLTSDALSAKKQTFMDSLKTEKTVKTPDVGGSVSESRTSFSNYSNTREEVMPTELLPIGMPWTMIGGRVYAVPAVECTLFTDAASTFTQSMTQAFTLNQAVTLTAGSAALTGGFLKASVDTLVLLKRD